MELTVKLFATLREGRGKVLTLQYEEPPTLEEVTSRLEIAPEDIAILLRNGRDAALDQRVGDGDTVSIFPPVGGG